MNETNINSVAVNDHGHTDAASVDLVQLLHTYMPREALRRVVVDQVKAALIEHLRCADDADALDRAENIAHLRQASAVALPPELCTLMARVAFDKSLFTYGQVDGRAAGFAEGVWLLKFVGLADDSQMGAPRSALRDHPHAIARQA